MKKYTCRMIVGCAAIIFALSTMALAGGHKDGYCKKGLDDKLIGKFHFVLQNEDELALTPEQTHDIKELKKSVKKKVIESEAAVDIIKVDLYAAMSEDPMNVDLVNDLIDKKYDEKKHKAKLLIQSYSKFQSILNDEQKEKMKTMCREQKKQKMNCGSMKDCPMKK